MESERSQRQPFFRVKKENIILIHSGRSVVRLSRLVWDQEVAGSNPAAPTEIEKVLVLKSIEIY